MALATTPAVRFLDKDPCGGAACSDASLQAVGGDASLPVTQQERIGGERGIARPRMCHGGRRFQDRHQSATWRLEHASAAGSEYPAHLQSMKSVAPCLHVPEFLIRPAGVIAGRSQLKIPCMQAGGKVESDPVENHLFLRAQPPSLVIKEATAASPLETPDYLCQWN